MPIQTLTENSTRLKQFIQDDADALIATLRFYVVRANLAWGPAASGVATELLNDVTIEALEHAERFDPARQPKAWLLGIAANLIRRRQTQQARRNRRETLVGDLRPPTDDELSDDELFDQILGLSRQVAPDDGTAREHVDKLLASLPETDRLLVNLAVMYEMNGEALGRALNISPGAARVRLHRALNRLRLAYINQTTPKDGSHG